MEISRNWRLRHQRYRLLASKCECGTIHFPPRTICQACGKKSMKKVNLSGKGEILSFASVTSAPLEFEDYIPYFVALIRLDEDLLIEAQLADCDNPEVGMRVEMVTRKWREQGRWKVRSVYTLFGGFQAVL